MSLPLIYKISPIFLQNAMINLQGYIIKNTRFNSNFEKELLWYIQNSPNRTEVNLDDFKLFLETSMQSIFWKNRFQEYGVDIHSSSPLEEIKKLPVLTKHEVKQNIETIAISPKGQKIKSVGTSGTTGSGLNFQQTQQMENKQWAVWWRYRIENGISRDMWMGWFGGRPIVPFSQDTKPFWRINYPLKQVMFSAHHLNKKTIYDYHKKLSDSKLQWIHGYPSQLTYLAELIKEADLPQLNSLKYITTGSENLHSHQRAKIIEVFGIDPIQHYGLAEGVSNISQTKEGNLVMDQDFAYTELIPSSQENSFKIIGTNYHNLSFPLIRYDTNDLLTAEITSKQTYHISSIDGRSDDYIKLPNGVKIGRLGHLFKNAVNVKEAQIIQNSLDKVIFRIVKSENYDETNDEKLLLREAADRLGTDISIQFEYVDEIEKTAAGKLKFVISTI